MHKPDRGVASVACPFYFRETGKQIVCEGFYEGSTTKMCFPSRTRKRRHLKEMCNQYRYDRCPLAAALVVKNVRMNERALRKEPGMSQTEEETNRRFEA